MPLFFQRVFFWAKKSLTNRLPDINSDSPAMLHSLYLSTDVVQQAIATQDKVIRKIAGQGSCVIVGRAADYVLRNYRNIVNIFVYAPAEYRVQRVMQVYEQKQVKTFAVLTK